MFDEATIQNGIPQGSAILFYTMNNNIYGLMVRYSIIVIIIVVILYADDGAIWP